LAPAASVILRISLNKVPTASSKRAAISLPT
jgi:hypothetical protein